MKKQVFTSIILLVISTFTAFGDGVTSDGHGIYLSKGFRISVGRFGSSEAGSNYWVTSSDWTKTYLLGHFSDAKAQSFYTLVTAAMALGTDIEIGIWNDPNIAANGTHGMMPDYVSIR